MNDASPNDPPDRPQLPWRRRCLPGWRTAAVIGLLLLATPLGIRWYRLSWMPDVPVPFDVDEFDASPVSDADMDADSYFRQAMLQSQQLTVDHELLDRLNTISWSDVPQDVRIQIEKNQPALLLFRQGARCSPRNPMRPSNYSLMTNAGISIQSYRDFERQLYLDALRLMDQGDTQEAAAVLHDAFRSTRHVGHRGSAIERLVGIAMHAVISPAWHHWARRRDVTAEQIETALPRLREDWGLTPPPSDMLKVEYLIVVNETRPPMAYLRDVFDVALDKRATRQLGLSTRPTTQGLNAAVPGWQIPILWVMGEPELTARAASLYLTHELKTCDLPYAEQPLRLGQKFALSQTRDLTAGITAETLSRRLSGSMLAEMLGPIAQVQGAIRREAGRQTILETELELQIRFRRGNAATRTDAERILAEFSWPIDPCSAEAKPIQYRAEDEGFVIWSLSYDGIDQGGITDQNVNKHRDIVVTVPWPDGTASGAER